VPITYDPPGVFGGVDTFENLVDEILSNLQGYTASPDQVTSLTTDIAASDTTFVVDDGDGIATGLVEIGEELVWVRSFDEQSTTAQTLPQGRGWRGTVPAAHSAGTLVTISPAVPRSAVVREVNNVIRSLYPSIYAVETTEFDFDDCSRVGWGIPAEAEGILDVRWKDVLGNWQPLRDWSMEKSLNLTDHATGSALYVRGVPVGRTVQVVYTRKPSVLTNLSQDWTECGLEDGSKDLLVLGTIARVLPMLDVARLSVTYAAAGEMDQPRPLGSAAALAKQLKADFTARLADERDVLNRRYPARWHRIVR
jgi:hypothetical protein